MIAAFSAAMSILAVLVAAVLVAQPQIFCSFVDLIVYWLFGVIDWSLLEIQLLVVKRRQQKLYRINQHHHHQQQTYQSFVDCLLVNVFITLLYWVMELSLFGINLLDEVPHRQQRRRFHRQHQHHQRTAAVIHTSVERTAGNPNCTVDDRPPIIKIHRTDLMAPHWNTTAVEPGIIRVSPACINGITMTCCSAACHIHSTSSLETNSSDGITSIPLFGSKCIQPDNVSNVNNVADGHADDNIIHAAASFIVKKEYLNNDATMAATNNNSKAIYIDSNLHHAGPAITTTRSSSKSIHTRFLSAECKCNDDSHHLDRAAAAISKHGHDNPNAASATDCHGSILMDSKAFVSCAVARRDGGADELDNDMTTRNGMSSSTHDDPVIKKARYFVDTDADSHHVTQPLNKSKNLNKISVFTPIESYDNDQSNSSCHFQDQHHGEPANSSIPAADIGSTIDNTRAHADLNAATKSKTTNKVPVVISDCARLESPFILSSSERVKLRRSNSTGLKVAQSLQELPKTVAPVVSRKRTSRCQPQRTSSGGMGAFRTRASASAALPSTAMNKRRRVDDSVSSKSMLSSLSDKSRRVACDKTTSLSHQSQHQEDTFEKLWNTRFEQLVEYKQQFGDCLVPHSFPENLQLGHWVNSQRRFYKKEPKAISDDRIERLNEIDFEWDVHEAHWESRFQQLLEYKQQRGDCLVQHQPSQGDRQLGTWVNRQRQYYPKNISQDRIRRLEDIGFEWNTR